MIQLPAESLARLQSVHPRLVAWVQNLAGLANQPFVVECGLRGVGEETQLRLHGRSHTQNSKHFPQADGWGYAVDLVPQIGGLSLWQLPPSQQWQFIYILAADAQRALGRGLELRWGGCWDRPLSELEGGAVGMAREHQAYMSRHPGALADGPHFEIHGVPQA